MKAVRLMLPSLALSAAALVCRGGPEITDFLPALQANPTWETNAKAPNTMVRYDKFPAWGEARIEFQEWIARDSLAPWVSLWKCRSRVPEADWQLLQRELRFMARFHVTPQYGMLVQEWEGSAGFVRDAAEWQKQIDRRSHKLGVLTQVASENVTGDLATTANFVWVQKVEAPRKAELIDTALKNWSTRRGFDEPAAWLLELGASGVVWNLPATWMAVDCFATKPDVAVKLLTRVDDPTLRQVAVLAIAAAASQPASLEPLRPLADAPTWALITKR